MYFLCVGISWLVYVIAWRYGFVEIESYMAPEFFEEEAWKR